MAKCNDVYWDRKFGPCDPNLPECHQCVVKLLIHDCECVKIINPDRLPNGALSCKCCDVPNPTKRPRLKIESLPFSCARPDCDKYKVTSKLCEGQELCKTKISLYKCACYTHETFHTNHCPGGKCMLNRPGGPRTKPQILLTYVHGQACEMCENAELSKMKQIRQAEEHRWNEDTRKAVRSEMPYEALRSDRILNPGNDQMAEKTGYTIERDTKRSTSRGSYERQYDSYTQSEPRSTNISNEVRRRQTLEPHESAPHHYPRSEYPHAYEPSESRPRYFPIPTIRPVFRSIVKPVTPPLPVDSEMAQRPVEHEAPAQQPQLQLEQDQARYAETAYRAAATHVKKVQEDALSFERAEHWEAHAFPHRSPIRHRARKSPLKSALKTPAVQRSSSSRSGASSSHNFEPDVDGESEMEERGRGRPRERM